METFKDGFLKSVGDLLDVKLVEVSVEILRRERLLNQREHELNMREQELNKREAQLNNACAGSDIVLYRPMPSMQNMNAVHSPNNPEMHHRRSPRLREVVEAIEIPVKVEGPPEKRPKTNLNQPNPPPVTQEPFVSSHSSSVINNADMAVDGRDISFPSGGSKHSSTLKMLQERLCKMKMLDVHQIPLSTSNEKVFVAFVTAIVSKKPDLYKPTAFYFSPQQESGNCKSGRLTFASHVATTWCYDNIGGVEIDGMTLHLKRPKGYNALHPPTLTAAATAQSVHHSILDTVRISNIKGLGHNFDEWELLLQFFRPLRVEGDPKDFLVVTFASKAAAQHMISQLHNDQYTFNDRTSRTIKTLNIKCDNVAK